MTLDIITYLVILIIIGEIIEYEQSFKHLFLINVGLLFITLNLSTLVDFSLTYAVPLTVGFLVYGSHRAFVIASTNKRRDWDDEL